MLSSDSSDDATMLPPFRGNPLIRVVTLLVLLVTSRPGIGVDSSPPSVTPATESRPPEVFERVNAELVGRPDLMGGHASITLAEGMTGMTENVFLNIKNKSKTITADIDVPEGRANGAILVQGGRFGGWGLYVKGGVPGYDYNFLSLSSEPAHKLRLTGNAVRMEPNEIAMQTRSLYGCMYALAQGISVPAEHIQGRQTSTRPSPIEEEDAPRWLRVEYSRLPRIDPFAQVFYNGYWFYLDKSDWSSKRTFALLTYMFSLQSTAKGQAGPLLTVPAGR